MEKELMQREPGRGLITRSRTGLFGVVVLGLAALFLLAACGADPTPIPTATPTPTTAPAPAAATATPEPTPTPEPIAPEGYGQSYEEIIALAREETASEPLLYCQSTGPAQMKLKTKGFEERYPGINTKVERCRGTEIPQRLLLEFRAGVVFFETTNVARELAAQFLEADAMDGPFNFKALFPPEYGIEGRRTDIGGVEGLALAQPMDVSITGLAFNRDKVPQERWPDAFADCLDPYWSLRMTVDTRPTGLRMLGHPQLLGERFLLEELGTKLAANNPIWVRGQSRSRAQFLAGELDFQCGASFESAMRDLVFPGSPIEVVVPREIRELGKIGATMSNGNMVFKGASKPNAALLVGTYMNSDLAELPYLEDPTQVWSVSSSVPGSPMGKLLADLGIEVIDLSADEELILELHNKLVEAWGFPTPRPR